ncbi:MAG: aminotransferase class V-fold PLP-dependent enzyme [Acidobacteriota bacterium]
MVPYLDCAATTPVDPRVRDTILRYLDEDFGNAGSRTHDAGRRARSAVEQARERVASVVAAARGDVIFTSGATESNNLALLGLAAYGERTGRRHIVSTAIEHHAVLEPLAALSARGFDVEMLAPSPAGVVSAAEVARAVGPETLLVSVMHVNNETGIEQPIAEIADALGGSDTYLHVDAAQGYGRALEALCHPRLDLIAISGHKIHAPKGVGALVTRRRHGVRPPLEPLTFGGGQERGLRPGTLAVPLIAGLGEAARLAREECDSRAERCRAFRAQLLDGLASASFVINGDPALGVPHIVSLAFPGLDGEQVVDAWVDLVAVSQGAACTSQSYVCSHVLSAMRLPSWQQEGAIRLSWCHSTPLPDVSAMVAALRRTRSSVSASGS